MLFLLLCLLLLFFPAKYRLCTIKDVDNPKIRVKSQKQNGLEYSSIYCTSNEPTERVCRIKNLYYNASSRVFYINYHPLLSIMHNCKFSKGRFLDWSSIQNHNVYFWNYKVFRIFTKDSDL